MLFEHFSLANGERIAREVHSVQRQGGCFRVIVPDAERVLQPYFESPEELVEWRGSGTETPMEIVNLYFRQRYEHQFLYDWATMEKMLLSAGFNEVFRSAFGQKDPFLQVVLDNRKYEWESL